jgi:hypothetical protein
MSTSAYTLAFAIAFGPLLLLLLSSPTPEDTPDKISQTGGRRVKLRR